MSIGHMITILLIQFLASALFLMSFRDNFNDRKFECKINKKGFFPGKTEKYIFDKVDKIYHNLDVIGNVFITLLLLQLVFIAGGQFITRGFVNGYNNIEIREGNNCICTPTKEDISLAKVKMIENNARLLRALKEINKDGYGIFDPYITDRIYEIPVKGDVGP